MFPTAKPITIVVPFSAGGPTDRVARDFAEAMRKPLGCIRIVVANSAGTAGSIGSPTVDKAHQSHTHLLPPPPSPSPTPNRCSHPP